MNEKFRSRIENKKLTIGIIGMGYVGLPLVLAFAEKGFKTIGFDTDELKIQKLGSGITYINHISSSEIAALNNSGCFTATRDFSRLSDVDVIIVCVPTPLSPQREPDMSYVIATAQTITRYLKKEHLIILESTTYPGTTQDVLRPELEKGGLTCGTDFFLAYSPEREDPGNKSFNARNIPKVIGSDSSEGLQRADAVYSLIVAETVPVSSTPTAEAVKLTENIFRSVNIALVNELKIIYGKMGIDIWEVIDAAKTKPFGYMPFYPGPGLGGHCIPIDPFYLTWKAREFESTTRFIELAGEINVSMPGYVVNKLTEALNEREKALKNASVLVVGLSYKPDVDDVRESPSLKLLELLIKKGARVAYHDPYVPRMKKTRQYGMLLDMQSISLDRDTLKKYDAVIISTAHSAIDYQMLVEHARLVIDTRNATKDFPAPQGNIIKA